MAQHKKFEIGVCSVQKTLNVVSDSNIISFLRMAELLRWVKEDLREDESLLLFGHQSRVQQIAGARGAITIGMDHHPCADHLLVLLGYTQWVGSFWGHYM